MNLFDLRDEGGPPGDSRREAAAEALAPAILHPESLAGVDLICLSHLRWNFVFQRPQHLLSRRARHGRVFFFEEPLPTDEPSAFLDVSESPEGVTVAVPRLPPDISDEQAEAIRRELLDGLIADRKISRFVLWVYTPMMLGLTRHLSPAAVVYDCMDELSAFRGAPPKLQEREAELFGIADVVFTGGRSLYEAKRGKHGNVHAFPSSIDAAHFAKARLPQAEPADQAGIPHPRLGFAGVIDERLDRELLRQVAEARPDWQFVMLGPVVKIDPADLPTAPNIHYLGGKSYSDLPAYMAGWDAALLLFAHNESTRYISPTKTPEYLAAGRPVVSTSIRDVVRPYGEMRLVEIADDTPEFIAAVERALARRSDPVWRARVDAFLQLSSWDRTCAEMFHHVAEVVARKSSAQDLPLTDSLDRPAADESRSHV